MKTTKEERILKFIKKIMRQYSVNKYYTDMIEKKILENDPYLLNSRLSVEERTFIYDEVKKWRR